MKFEKIISLSLFHGVLFLISASIITGCQKKNFEKAGYFSDSFHKNFRLPASSDVNNLSSKFEKYQDPKQVYLFCALSATDKAKCYKHQINQVLVKFQKKHGKLKSDEKKELNEFFSYGNIQSQIEKIKFQIMDKIDPDMYKIVLKRSDFCAKNSTINLKRCMKQFKNKDSLALLNHYQKKHGNLNAHEYLYSQNFILGEMEQRLDKAIYHIQNPTSDVRVPAYDHKGVRTNTSH